MGTFDEHPRGALHAYLDGELSLEGSLEVEAHLAECGACRRELETYRALRRLLVSAKASAPEAESALMKVTRSVRMRRRGPAPMRDVGTARRTTGAADRVPSPRSAQGTSGKSTSPGALAPGPAPTPVGTAP